MIKNKYAQTVRWLGVFSTVKKLVEKRLISPYKEVAFTGEIEIKGRKKVQIRCCTKGNSVTRDKKLYCFFDKITPECFDYLVCVLFDKNKDVQGHYIFTKQEVIDYFPYMVDIHGKIKKEYKGLYIPLDENIGGPLDSIVENSFENWEKIR
ncbi:hypothetical protein SAMN05443428_101216 [Caloramator quimbayensis]|uniref:Uncharacterized protein n=1 Tax=Caloramator quimbayensis TaxID=1147123 RepID=A0A1T4WGZ6_9CLOT|nr:hypothetical protein [Caloramator quimbayensis]SKA76562.1 hypothetical protein SAMN05443428_101216 [Caloramator quimbayensis]